MISIIASKIALLYDVLKNIPKKAGYKKYLGDQYDNFMETFAEVYRKFIDDKDVQGLADFKKEVVLLNSNPSSSFFCFSISMALTS